MISLNALLVWFAPPLLSMVTFLRRDLTASKLSATSKLALSALISDSRLQLSRAIRSGASSKGMPTVEADRLIPCRMNSARAW